MSNIVTCFQLLPGRISLVHLSKRGHKKLFRRSRRSNTVDSALRTSRRLSEIGNRDATDLGTSAKGGKELGSGCGISVLFDAGTRPRARRRHCR